MSAEKKLAWDSKFTTDSCDELLSALIPRNNLFFHTWLELWAAFAINVYLFGSQ